MREDKNMQNLLAKIAKLKQSGEVDLSLEEDLSLAIMNLVSLEEHFFFTAQKTGKDEYLNFLVEVRDLRKELLARMLNQNEGETWCIGKHLLAASMRLMEVGTKLLSEGKREEAKEMFAKAYRLYGMFWGVRLKLINLEGIKKIDDDKLNVHDHAANTRPWSMEEILNKLVDCCDE